MGASIFTDPQKPPTASDLDNALGAMTMVLKGIIAYVHGASREAGEEWNFSKGFGWNLRMKDKKRALIYIMPCDGFFRASFVFGAKATEQAISSDLSDQIKEIISSARVYAEGRGFRVDVTDKDMARDIRLLIDIKLAAK